MSKQGSGKKRGKFCWMLAGATAGTLDFYWIGACSRTAVAPIARLRIIFQTNAIKAEKVKNPSIIEALSRIYRQEGVRGFFSGNMMNVLRIMPYSATRFYTYEFLNAIEGVEEGKPLPATTSFINGALAGLSATFVSYPLDLLRARFSMQQEQRVYRGIGDAVKDIYRNDGLRGFYKGLSPTVMGILPYSGINFMLYEKIKNVLVDSQPDMNKRLQHSISGAVSGAVAQTLTFPLDVIRRRMQVKGFQGTNVTYTGTWDAARTIVKQDGLFGLYHGIAPTYLRVIPAMAVTFLVYEWSKELFCSYGYANPAPLE